MGAKLIGKQEVSENGCLIPRNKCELSTDGSFSAERRKNVKVTMEVNFERINVSIPSMDMWRCGYLCAMHFIGFQSQKVFI